MDDLFSRVDGLIALVVDDDRGARLIAGSLLRQSGFTVEEACNGIEALSAFERFKPGIVLLDVVMPEMDGFAVCEKLRNGSEEGRHVPILMMTGLDDIDSINRAYDAGATDFITKPINWAIFRHRLRYIWRSTLVSDDLRKSEMKNRALIDAMPDLLLRISRDGRILELKESSGFDRFFSAAALLSRKISEVFTEEVSRPIVHNLHLALTVGGMQFFEHNLRAGEETRYYEWRIVRSAKEEAVAIVRDITGRKKTEESVFRLAYYDILTGLLNRNSFKEHLAQALAQAQRHGRNVATLFLDLDRFKRINDTFGYKVGDLLLQSVAERIMEGIRKSDIFARNVEAHVSDSVSRLGGDEFTILLPDITDVQDSAGVAKRILESVSRPFLIAGHEIFMTGSIGITLSPLDGADPDTLLKNADAAMYSAKEQGRNNYQFYSKTMNASSFERLSMENALRKALDRREFLVYYQPQVNIDSGKTVAMEALLRWEHPERGLVSPADFIPLAEETGLIVPIGEWVLGEACAFNRTLQKMGLPPRRISVNISSVQFRPKSLVQTIARVLKASGLDPRWLEVEVTESAIMKNMEQASGILHELKQMGLRVAIDDFGTGYSSLAYLKRFPLDLLKIDRSFIRDIPGDRDNEAIAAAIIVLAHSLKLEVIAEGVETEDQLEFLRDHGCDQVQGFIFSRPLPAEQLKDYLEKEPQLIAWTAARSAAGLDAPLSQV
ncbi:MAG TPA: EAL domain-containing protein [Syntrophobacteraceae bacterium]|nr:EAL domain-containing protein [Syntrophobacteraceae bacterium]